MENTKLQDIESKPYPKIKGIEIRLHHDKIIFMVYHSDTIYKFRFMAYDINGTPLSGEIIENIEDSINVSYDNLGIKIIDIINYVGNDSFPLSVQINSTLDNVSYISLEYYSKFFNHYIELYEIPKPKPAVGQYFAKIIQKKDPWMEKPWKSYNHRGYKLKNGILIIES